MGVVEERDRFRRAVTASLGVEFELAPPHSFEKIIGVEERLGFELPGQLKELFLAPRYLRSCRLNWPSWGDESSMVELTKVMWLAYAEGGYGPEVIEMPFVVVLNDAQCDVMLEPDRPDGSPGRLLVICSGDGTDHCNVYANSLESMYKILTECAEADLFDFEYHRDGKPIVDWWFIIAGEEPVAGDEKIGRLNEIRARYPGEGEILIPLV